MERENISGSSEGPKDGIIGSIDIPSLESVVDLTGIEVEGGLSVEESHFRGRKLQGATIPLPQGYSGFVLGKKKNPKKRKTSGISEDNLNCWETRAGFQSITYWNHDSLPSHDDVFLRSFHWFPVANALHKPVSVNDLAAASTLPGQS
ncbi:Ribonuclease H2 [Macleaya cordata]|uniref:Ribonuclease H2 n=1 Tax=Macleaya cordata TaxID=56857 RepID=A0A200QMU8_MACCD|nr:Ribonuclease H2 [Macleaya cordata]